GAEADVAREEAAERGIATLARAEAGKRDMRAEALAVGHQARAVKQAPDLPVKRGKRLGRRDGGKERLRLAPAEGAEPVEPDREGRGAQGFERLVRRLDPLHRLLAEKGESDVKGIRVGMPSDRQLRLQRLEPVADVLGHRDRDEGAHRRLRPPRSGAAGGGTASPSRTPAPDRRW